VNLLSPPRPDASPSGGADPQSDGGRWSDRPVLGRVLKLLVLLGPIMVSVGFVAVASRLVPRPEQWYGVVAWWIGLTASSTAVLVAAERVLRRFLPLVALFRLSLVFPDHAPSRFKVAMRTNTVRQVQRCLEAGQLDQDDFQEAAERLVGLAGALNTHDRMTRGHTDRVRAYALMIGEELHLPKGDVERLHWAGLVHDIGKLEVPASILNKPGRPDEDEWAILKQHPAAAVPLLESLRPWLGEWADAASQHHERWDGKGYPLGLVGEEISLSGRIVAVADAYDVMTSVRSYKKAMTPEAARAELARCAGTQFDATVVRAFMNISVGRLRLVMGPLSWLAQAPVLGNVPLGATAITAVSSLASIGIAVAAGLASGGAPTPVVAVADALTAQPVMIVGLEDERILLDATTGDDPPTSLTVTLLPDHLRLDSAAVLIPDENWFGRTVGEYQACWDDRCSTAQLDVDVRPVNDVPTAAADGATTPEATAVTIDVVANDNDLEDGRPVLVAVRSESSPASGTATLTSDGLVRFQPGDGFVGTVRLLYEVADLDGAAASGTVTIEVTAVDSPPRAVDDALTTRAGATQTIDVLANDTDDENEPLTIVDVTPLSVGEVVIEANTVRFSAPADAAGPTSFTYTIEDAGGGRSQATVYVTIIGADVPRTASPTPPTPTPTPTPPPATSPPATSPSPPPPPLSPTPTPTPSPTTTAPAATPTPPPPPTPAAAPQPSPTARPDETDVVEDAAPIEVDVLANDTSADGDPTNDTISIVGAPSNGTALIVGQRVRYQPSPDANGVDTVTYQVCETNNTCDTATLTVTIAARNDAPEFLDAGAVVVAEDSGPVSISAWATSISAGPLNESAQNVGFTVTVDQPAMFSTLPAVDANGALSFTPAPDVDGNAAITVTAVDDGGTDNGGADSSIAHTATITVTAVNDPVVAAADTATVDEDDIAGVTLDVLANDIDADADSLTVVSLDTSAITGGTVTDLGLGSLNYTPDPNFNGTETFTYTVIDGNGSSDTATVTITVEPIPDAPVASGDAFATDEDTALVVAAPGVIGNDYDYDDDVLAVTPTPIVGPSNGTVTLAIDGAFTYTPNSGFVGVDSFIYQLDDSTGRTANATVTITVDSGLSAGGLYLGITPGLGPWNMTTATPPTATPEPDYDIDGDPGFTVTTRGPFATKTWVQDITGSALDLNGPVTLELWSTLKDFETGAEGHPDITLFDCDNLGTGCVTVGRAAVHIDDYNGGVADWVRVDISLGNVTHTFPIGRQLRLQIEQRHNDLWIAASGTRPSRLRYTIANVAPVAVNDTPPAIIEDAGVTNIDVLANDIDTNLDVASVTITMAPANGTATPRPDGTIDYQPNPDANGADGFTYRVCDTGGLCATATVNVTITAVNDRPSFTVGPDITIDAVDPAYTRIGWATGISSGPANESSQTLTFGVTAADPTLFSVQPAVGPAGTLTFTPSGIVGTTAITVQLTDSGGGSNTSAPQNADITLS
jgi:hypothetical protein